MISAIAAVDENLGIGYNNELLCSIKEDLNRFRELTIGKIVIMGRKTWESLPKKPLPDRINIVVTNAVKEFSVSPDGVIYISLDFLKSVIKDIDKLFDAFVIGGGKIYKELLPYCNRIYLTEIEKSFENVDTYFPEFKNDKEWEIDKVYGFYKQDGIKYHFVDYIRGTKYKKQTFIINGSGGVGKDTFVSFVADSFSTMNVSSVDKVKEIARAIGWTGTKTEKDRKFLSDLKLLCTDYNDMPLNDMKKKFEKFNNDNDYNFLFLHIREPEEIDKAKAEFSAKTILIKNDSVKHITSNMADENVYNYNYDVVIDNSGSIDELVNKAYKFAKDSLNDKLKEEY